MENGQQQAPWRQTWAKFYRNPVGKVSLFVIVTLCLASTAGYLITPDKTPFANHQDLLIADLPPFSRVHTLEDVVRHPSPKHWWDLMLWGRSNERNSLPFDTIAWMSDSVSINEMGNGKTLSQSFLLADICFPLADKPCYSRHGDSISFNLDDGQRIVIALPNLLAEAKKNHVTQKTIPLGTDHYGRDVLSQLIIGSRVSLSVGLISVLISLIIGTFLGAVSGYFGGIVDDFVSWFIQVMWALPTLLLVIAITFVLGKGFWQVFIAIGLTMWVDVARIVRGQFLAIKPKEYVEAARSLGFSHGRIIFRHILPNAMAPVIVVSAANFASAILLESGLSFLGIGVQPPMPSWGSMMRENYSAIILGKPHLAVLPGLAIMVAVMAFMMAGNALRDAMDVKSVPAVS